ncbi:NAD(P)-dependent alcohol dehydrogenase [Thalassorhabdomicrobium marinisediminis]|uniref:NAD(P)-dependent alcohol dehydrogenase n=1 Tax=Thalassorhabdomicrobium marinisediminis TaxID=2170577 RepID=A0A2T7FY87_9RHOB|nr:NAD(P)-dependent alcohol dehydrogenase [Thalassorhabdomicrobium marinisediminis]PVA07129.1 NAD(P)-dependent alcohol dehydrogenase [Thalassorhabdomicrobium marinisediminis]
MTATRTAWHIPHYGRPDTLTPVTLPMPQPGPNEVLIRIHASAVTRADGMMRKGEPLFARPFLGLRRPRNGLSGTGLSGEVMATGNKVSRFASGDLVFGEAGMHFGANASHICLDEGGVLMPKPASLSHEEAAVLCDGVLTSWHYLHNLGEVQSGDRVLILGGAGSLGSAAVQIAAHMGAEVTATCSARNASFVASLGADQVIDYNAEDALQRGAGYDVIFDTLGVGTFSTAKPALADTGRYLCPVLTLGRLPAILLSRLGRKRALFAAAGLEKPQRLRAMLSEILTQIEQDHLTPIIDRTYLLSDLLEAHAYVEAGHKRGNVVVV